MDILPSSHGSAVSVVIVEDNEDDRDLLIRQLRKRKLADHVRFFSDGREALDFLSELPPPAPFIDLTAIFLDLKLPGISGITLLQEIRRMPRVQNIPVIIMTASLDPRDFEACLALKVAAFIPKPVTFDLFTAALTHLPYVLPPVYSAPAIQTTARPD